MVRRKGKEVSRALNAVRRMVRGLRSAAEAVERDFRISAAQLFVLTELGSVPDQSVKDLAAVTMTTHSTVSQVVGQLISKGLVAKTTDSTDARRSVLRLTGEGQGVLRKAPRAVQEDLIEGFASLSPTLQRAVATGLEKWLDASGMGRVQSGMLFERPLIVPKSRTRAGRTKKTAGGRRSGK
jgi:DNA-binding MarR family transcriptional regulator